MLTPILLTVPYALWRGRRISYSWGAARSFFDTCVNRIEKRRIFGLMNRQLRAAKESGRSVLLHIWGPATLTPLLLDWAELVNVPAIYHEMGEADEKYVHAWSLESTIQHLDRIAALVCCSTAVADSVRKVYRYAGPLYTIPFMICDPEPCSLRANGERVTVGAIGRLVPHKRHRDLLQAVQTLSENGLDVGLVIAGDGPLRESLEAFSADLGIQDRVSFTGEFERLSEVMASFDIFCLTSSSESQCMPITESMAYGKPVIGSDFGGIPDFIEDGVTGYVVPVGDRNRLVSALERLAKSPDLRRKMGESGHARFIERYTQAAVTSQIEAVYKKALETGCGRVDRLRPA